GDVAYTITPGPALSADPFYNGLQGATISVLNREADTAAFIITPTSPLETTAAGGMATFAVRLTSQPTTPVTISLVLDNAQEGTVSASRLTFTSANWNVAQTVTITGTDDGQTGGYVPYHIVLGPSVSGDPNYDGLSPGNVAVTNELNEAAALD